MNKQFKLSHVEGVQPLEGLWIRVSFSDGAVMDIGLENMLGENPGIFAPVLEDREFFEQVRVNPEARVVEWPGELDLDADVMYGTFKAVSGRDYERRIVKEPTLSRA
jgi:hypothetical protein